MWVSSLWRLEFGAINNLGRALPHGTLSGGGVLSVATLVLRS
jgi:hypothetical protein